MNNDVVIIDSGGANIASLMFALERLGATATLTTDKEVIGNAPRVILPGVGAAADAMQRLEQHDLLELIPGLTQPVLGVCLGMQLLAEHSAEGDTSCLGVIPATAAKLPDDQGIPVPNMGWCRIKSKGELPLLHGIEDGSWFYFVHSYALPTGDYSCADARHVDEFCAIAAQANFYAAQCHPERSANAGARLLKNFLQMS